MSKKQYTKLLEEEIIERLYTGPRRVNGLVEEIAYVKQVSVQGVYKALRILKTREVVTVHDHMVSLSLVWLRNQREKFSFAEEAYRSSLYIEDIRTGKRKRAHFTFQTLNEIDLFWTHAYLLIAENLKNDVYSDNVQPHDWYAYVRYETDTFWVKTHRESGRISRTVLTHPGKLDHKVIRLRKEQLGNLFQYTLNVNPLHQDSCTYYNVIGPYIFTVRFDVQIADRLDKFVATYDVLPLVDVVQKEINEIVEMKGKFTLTIERSESKAADMRQKVKKFFEF